MLTLLQPSYGMSSAPLSAAEPTAKLLEKQLQGRHAAVVPTGAPLSTGASDASLETLVEAAADVPSAYGLVSAMTPQDVAEHYAAADKLMSVNYDDRAIGKSQKEIDI